MAAIVRDRSQASDTFVFIINIVIRTTSVRHLSEII